MNIYTPEWKQHIIKNIQKKYTDGNSEILGWLPHRIENAIMNEEWTLTWNRMDVTFTKLKEDPDTHLTLKGVVTHPPEYIELALKKERIIGLPIYGTVLLQSDRGTEYTIQKSPDYDYDITKLREETPSDARVSVLINTKVSPWEFVKILVEPPEEEDCDSLEFDEDFKKSRLIINGC